MKAATRACSAETRKVRSAEEATRLLIGVIGRVPEQAGESLGVDEEDDAMSASRTLRSCMSRRAWRACGAAHEWHPLRGRSPSSFHGSAADRIDRKAHSPSRMNGEDAIAFRSQVAALAAPKNRRRS